MHENAPHCAGCGNAQEPYFGWIVHEGVLYCANSCIPDEN